MSGVKNILGDSVYSILYCHYDRNGNYIDDMEDVLYCADEDILPSKVSELIDLVSFDKHETSILKSIEASKILSAWGVKNGIDYFLFYIDNGFYLDCVISPNRLNSQKDDIFEEILYSCFKYYARYAEREFNQNGKVGGNLSLTARAEIKPLIDKIISLVGIVNIDITYLLRMLDAYNWLDFEESLKHLLTLLSESHDSNKKLNVNKLSVLLEKWSGRRC
ncbi:hypothetical protein ACFFLZ_12675 [Photobacterium aphoticum]|uniref:Uncharacterized protein n=1 Tax=Photobacterium aphoticum TaxID=754436 RepID=A0A0J1GS98_9GAMM|nr:hypothetical protein [Photobacterium aphoticum]KLV02294.1 hypothetical protein ABT58_03855 [Photobacterium aphoticum]PSU57722.1 hypothetical protein C9I90_08665 [Photobacterium aphoticum]GHA55301.1 hypothetical protein GCM10007086_31770 [Photobacterium aphoticum]